MASELAAFEDVAHCLNELDLDAKPELSWAADISSSSRPSFADAASTEASSSSSSSTEAGSSSSPSPLQFGDKGGIDPEIDAEHEIVVKQADGASELFSATKFEDLNLRPEILKAIFAMGWSQPSAIQGKALPLILKSSKQNMIAQAQSGTGKTGTFSISMLMRVDASKKHPQAICVLPTIELAGQVSKVVAQLAAGTNITVQKIVKEEVLPKDIPSQILVGTPGKLLDALKRKHFQPKHIKMFVLDEADQMIAAAEGAFSLSRQTAELKNKCTAAQILCFSATFPDNVREFARRLVPDPVNLIVLKPSERAVKKITQIYIQCPCDPKVPKSIPQGKLQVLSQIYKELIIPQSMIFVRTKVSANVLASNMEKAGFTVSVMTGDNTVADRARIFGEFACGKSKVLITTNLLARGIDIRTVTLIINFDLPTLQDESKPDVSTYLHRVGRTGRFGNEGLAINLVSTREDLAMVNFFKEDLSTEIDPYPADNIPKLQKMLDKINEANAMVQQ